MQGGAAQEEVDRQHWDLAVGETDSVSVVFCRYYCFSSNLEIHFPLTILLNEGGT